MVKRYATFLHTAQVYWWWWSFPTMKWLWICLGTVILFVCTHDYVGRCGSSPPPPYKSFRILIYTLLEIKQNVFPDVQDNVDSHNCANGFSYRSEHTFTVCSFYRRVLKSLNVVATYFVMFIVCRHVVESYMVRF